jgi:hypothetical protein
MEVSQSCKRFDRCVVFSACAAPRFGSLHFLGLFADGIALLEVIEKVSPGTVDFKRVNSDRARLNKFKKVSRA